SAQQSPPKSAALAGLALMAKPPSVIPSAAAMAMRLDVFVSPPNMSISTFPDKKLPNPNSRSGLASRRHPVESHHERRDRTPPIREFYFAYKDSFRKVNCYPRRRGRFQNSCDISATKIRPSP